VTYQPGGSGYGEGQQPTYGQQQPQQQYPQQYGQQQYGGQPQYGYGQYGGYQQPARQGLPVNLWQYLVYGIGVLGLVNLFIGFAPGLSGGSGDGNHVYLFVFVAPLLLLAAGGLLALPSLLPKQARYAAPVAVLSIVGALVVLFQIIVVPTSSATEYSESSDIGIGTILLCVFGFIQAALAVAWLLVEAGVIKTGPVAPAGPDTYAQQVAAQQAAAQQAAQSQQYGQQAQTYGQAAAGGGYGQTTAVGYGQSSSAPTTATPTAAPPAAQSAQSAATPYSQAAAPIEDDAEAGTSIISTAGTAAAGASDEATTAIGGAFGQHAAPAQPAADEAADQLKKPEGQ